jgi:hypothetical protein
MRSPTDLSRPISDCAELDLESALDTEHEADVARGCPTRRRRSQWFLRRWRGVVVEDVTEDVGELALDRARHLVGHRKCSALHLRFSGGNFTFPTARRTRVARMRLPGKTSFRDAGSRALRL